MNDAHSLPEAAVVLAVPTTDSFPQTLVRAPVDEAIANLYKRIRFTQGARFIAERRLRWHDRFTQFTLAFHAIALIAVPVLKLAGVQSRLGVSVVNAAEVLLAVFVLALALLLGQVNFAVRAEAMSRCARALLRLERHLEVVRRRPGTEEEYLRFANKYARIIEESDAHRPIDFKLLRVQRRDQHYKDRPIAYLRDYSIARAQAAIEFGGYLLSLIIPLALLYSFWPVQ